MPKKKGEHVITSKILYDVNENKEYASYTIIKDTNQIMDCNVLGEPVSSKAEWDNQVKQYMEE